MDDNKRCPFGVRSDCKSCNIYDDAKSKCSFVIIGSNLAELSSQVNELVHVLKPKKD